MDPAPLVLRLGSPPEPQSFPGSGAGILRDKVTRPENFIRLSGGLVPPGYPGMLTREIS